MLPKSCLEDLEVQPQAVAPDVVEVEDRLLGHVVGLSPQPRQSRPQRQVTCRFRSAADKRRPRPNQAQLTPEDIDQPRELAQELGAKGWHRPKAEQVEGGALVA